MRAAQHILTTWGANLASALKSSERSPRNTRDIPLLNSHQDVYGNVYTQSRVDRTTRARTVDIKHCCMFLLGLRAAAVGKHNKTVGVAVASSTIPSTTLTNDTRKTCKDFGDFGVAPTHSKHQISRKKTFTTRKPNITCKSGISCSLLTRLQPSGLPFRTQTLVEHV